MEKAKGARAPGTNRGASNNTTASLAELGITKDQSAQWQKLADVPEPQFEAALAREIRLRAERKAGRLLQRMQKAKGGAGPGRGKAGHAAGPAFNEAPTLRDLGITKNQSAQWQELADVSDAQFETALAGPGKQNPFHSGRSFDPSRPASTSSATARVKSTKK
jgi:hypothetical protein